LVSVFVTGSAHAGSVLCAVLGLPEGKVLNLPNGISPRQPTETKETTLRRLGIKPGRLVIGVVALLEERKGHIYLLRALKQLAQTYGGNALPQVLIEGEGPERDSLAAYVREVGLDEDVRFIGSEDNIYNFMQAVDVIAVPSIANEDFPNVVLEGMSLGKPVIASRLAGTPEQITHLEDGILVEPRDVGGLADAMGQLASDEALRDLLGRSALQKFNHQFASNIAVDNYIDLYKSLLNRVEH